MTRFVKILQIEGVVPCLIDRRDVERRRADLELQDEDDAADQQHDIDSSPHTRDAELEENESGQPVKALPQKVDLHHPRITLRLQHVEAAVPGQGSEGLCAAGGTKAVD